jgi:AbrB family looped-hinge helix DNA binding protein
METTRLSTRGQITLPKSIRVSRGWGPGTEFTLEESGDGILLRPAARSPQWGFDDVAGCLRYSGKPKTLAEMREGIKQAVKRRYERSQT